MVGKYGDRGQNVLPAAVKTVPHRCCRTCDRWEPTSGRGYFGRCPLGWRNLDGTRVPLVTMANDCGGCKKWVLGSWLPKRMVPPKRKQKPATRPKLRAGEGE